MAKKHKATKSKRKIKTVKLTPDTIVKVAVPKGIVPSVITDPASGAVHVLPLPATKLKDKGWFERWFG